MSTDQTGHEQPTVPIRRPTGMRDDEPTQVVETMGRTGGGDEDGGVRPAAGHDAPPTTPLPTSTPSTAPLPTSGPATAPLPTSGPSPTAPLPTGGTTPTRPRGGAAAEPPRDPVGGVQAAGVAGTAGATAPGVGTAGVTGSTTGSAPTPAGGPAPTSAAAAPAPTSARTGTTTLPAPDDTPGTNDPGADARGVGPASRTLRVGTVVWGLVVAIIGVGLVAVAAGARFDPELVLIGLLALAGAGLVAGSVAVNLRRRR